MKAYWRYVILYEIRRFWGQRAVWWVLRLIPRDIKKWVVVQSAVLADFDGPPGDVTYKEMHDVWSTNG